ncbi:hypothetical protein METBIDRAFT_227317 [Metschnikowia bicuspidata var. bicuspidata NRRL YB-4993]|uniref:Uncharacterized protein n=1 Tax=Metschnikowia bicuspidata var. bicuspidata NRRL YB-4993 TaxID=869754 RepID=A0A1A0H271_9ASCO|nr:hypothetical protein METBIDRAFT_227317 [Metschnikowia bicuspidata var. bicuspidata NRRL YB-4993]OBA18050.1 hypothetical protein METBIDRAFT_227317 [Metschnikowia bicuspidata var. bicuspidata NRRL YB-4993]
MATSGAGRCALRLKLNNWRVPIGAGDARQGQILGRCSAMPWRAQGLKSGRRGDTARADYYQALIGQQGHEAVRRHGAWRASSVPWQSGAETPCLFLLCCGFALLCFCYYCFDLLCFCCSLLCFVVFLLFLLCFVVFFCCFALLVLRFIVLCWDPGLACVGAIPRYAVELALRRQHSRVEEDECAWRVCANSGRNTTLMPGDGRIEEKTPRKKNALHKQRAWECRRRASDLPGVPVGTRGLDPSSAGIARTCIVRRHQTAPGPSR